jgi:RHS repeat-associated protein
MLKVMAGDKVDIFGNSYYLNTAQINNTNSTPLDYATILAGWLGAPGGGLAGKGLNTNLLGQINNGLIPASFIRGNNNESPTTVPKAYINYLFFDEQFQYVSGGFSRVGSSGQLKRHWFEDAGLQNITVPKNGYIFVYVSNESNLNVFFDNVQVIHKPGALLEETHYYPFGLTMAGISSKAAGKLENRYKFNEGTEFNTDLGLDWYETTFRGYDPQIGRFHQIDALADANPSWSTYSFVQNNPIAFIDPLGLDTFNVKNIPDGRDFNTSDVLVNDAGTMVGYWNGESWAQMFSELDDVAVVGSQKSSGGGRSNNGLGNFINSAGFVGFSRGYSIGTSSWDIYKYRFANANPDVLAFRNNTFLATANSGATKAFKMSFVGNQHYSSYRVNVMKWAFLESKSLAKLRFLEKGGFALNILGSGMVATDIMVNGFNAQNSTDAAFNVIGYAGPYGMAISAAYNVVKIGLPSDTAELRRLGEASLNGHIVHPYQVMGGLSPGFQISPSIIK